LWEGWCGALQQDLMREQGRHIPGAKARHHGWSFDVRTEVRTYLRGQEREYGKRNDRDSERKSSE